MKDPFTQAVLICQLICVQPYINRRGYLEVIYVVWESDYVRWTKKRVGRSMSQPVRYYTRTKTFAWME